MDELCRQVIAAIAPRAKPDIVQSIAENALGVFTANDIDTINRQASIFAHMCVESAGFTALSENLNYSAKRLTQVWPKRFPTLASTQGYANNPQALANKVYNGRMGNAVNSNDGWTFRGKGLLQLTGRDNVSRLAKRLGVSPEMTADWLVSPDHSLECAAQVYNMLNVGPAADAEDMKTQTLRVNGGLNGYDERLRAYTLAKRVLSAGVVNMV